MSHTPRPPANLALLIGAVVIGASSAVITAQVKVTATPTPESDPRIVQLEQRIRDLETRVKALEDEGEFPQDDKSGAAPPTGRDTGGAAGRGGEPGVSSGRGAGRATRLKAPLEIEDDGGKVILRIEKGPAGGGVVRAITSNGGTAAGSGRTYGDVCATSLKGGMCLSVLAVKTMNPY